jgi:hypothetical protein
MTNLFKVITISFLLIAISADTEAVNSIQTYDMQSGYFGIETGYEKSSAVGKAVWGLALNEFISAYMGMDLMGNKHLSDGTVGLFSGIIVDVAYFNRTTVVLTLESGLTNESSFYFRPGMNLNFDYSPEQSAWGVYLNSSEMITGTDASPGADDPLTLDIDESAPSYMISPETDLSFGVYFSIIKRQQIHIVVDQRIRHNSQLYGKNYAFDGVTLGYNFMVSNFVQIQTQVTWDMPQTTEKNDLGFKIGLVKW